MRLRQVRTGKQIPLHAPQFFFARDRQIAEEAFAGDVVGIPNHGTLRIGDTLTEDEDLNFVGVPYFAPEILRRVRLDDAMKAKKLRRRCRNWPRKASCSSSARRMAASRSSASWARCSSTCCIARMTGEYGVAHRLRGGALRARPLDQRREGRSRALRRREPHRMADDVDGDPVYLASSAFMMKRTAELHPALGFRDIKDIRPDAA